MVWVKWISKDKIREVKEKVMAKRHGLVQRRKASAESSIRTLGRRGNKQFGGIQRSPAL